MAQKPKRVAGTEPDYAEEPIISVDMDPVQAVHAALEVAPEKPEELERVLEAAGSEHEPVVEASAEPSAPLSEEELLKKRLVQIEREVFDMRATLSNITPLVVRGVPQGEVLFYLQSLDQRITVIENYLRMVTSS